MTVSDRPQLARSPLVPLLDFDVLEPSDPVADLRCDVVALHGANSDKRQFRDLMSDATFSGRRRVLPSLRGHGDSPSPAWGQSSLEFAADLWRIADVFTDRFHLFGYSLGGLVAATAAQTWARGRVLSLTLLDTGLHPRPELHRWDHKWAEGSHLRWNFDFHHLLEQAPCPVLMLHASDSDAVAPSTLRLVQEREEQIRVRRIPGTHASCVDRTREIVTSIAEFLRSFGLQDS